MIYYFEYELSPKGSGRLSSVINKYLIAPQL